MTPEIKSLIRNNYMKNEMLAIKKLNYMEKI